MRWTGPTPKRLEFIGIAIDKRTTIRRGKTTLLVVEYGDDSFVTADPKTQVQTRWFRAQTHRRFLTFASRGGPSPSAFAMWTTLDGGEPKIEALGLWMGMGAERRRSSARSLPSFPRVRK